MHLTIRTRATIDPRDLDLEQLAQAIDLTAIVREYDVEDVAHAVANGTPSLYNFAKALAAEDLMSFDALAQAIEDVRTGA
jgi:hypothetical protein